MHELCAIRFVDFENDFQQFKSYPKSTITWKHNGRDISDASDNIMVKDDRLIINKPTKYSRGYYQCYVENDEGIAYGLVNVNIKPKMTRNQVPANQNKSENRLKIKSSTCVQRADGDFEIRFEWKTKQISIDGFIYRVEFENTKARSNPLYRNGLDEFSNCSLHLAL